MKIDKEMVWRSKSKINCSNSAINLTPRKIVVEQEFSSLYRKKIKLYGEINISKNQVDIENSFRVIR